MCGDDGDCNGKGACVNSKCDCVPGWDSSFDCHGEYLLLSALQGWENSHYIKWKWYVLVERSQPKWIAF